MRPSRLLDEPVVRVFEQLLAELGGCARHYSALGRSTTAGGRRLRNATGLKSQRCVRR